MTHAGVRADQCKLECRLIHTFCNNKLTDDSSFLLEGLFRLLVHGGLRDHQSSDNGISEQSPNPGFSLRFIPKKIGNVREVLERLGVEISRDGHGGGKNNKQGKRPREN
jgi:hypothetical protein